MKLLKISSAAFLLLFSHSARAQSDQDTERPGTSEIGTTIVGDQEAPLGLFFAPWKESSTLDLIHAPGLHDAAAAPVDAEGFARAARYHSVGRAYRTERLMRNH